ncbi:hypothetical protein CJJ23_04400 [Mycoplasmopsis agassizii]|uniref:Flippase-like domain-containing protein n=1 Tax=Mycoplasmopsis agassizii TaxID=33922 RepID=A0A269THK1_9BACT|nr:lysylphosphatidylglycerol synthase transmembrane domain-containing protein [Mycoplasmopsis agassizii]PAK20953.1 hypothetical protein CJJ23_04400 [Mycoplasmopsis agassizii]
MLNRKFKDDILSIETRFDILKNQVSFFTSLEETKIKKIFEIIKNKKSIKFNSNNKILISHFNTNKSNHALHIIKETLKESFNIYNVKEEIIYDEFNLLKRANLEYFDFAISIEKDINNERIILKFFDSNFNKIDILTGESFKDIDLSLTTKKVENIFFDKSNYFFINTIREFELFKNYNNLFEDFNDSVVHKNSWKYKNDLKQSNKSIRNKYLQAWLKIKSNQENIFLVSKSNISFLYKKNNRKMQSYNINELFLLWLVYLKETNKDNEYFFNFSYSVSNEIINFCKANKINYEKSFYKNPQDKNTVFFNGVDQLIFDNDESKNLVLQSQNFLLMINHFKNLNTTLFSVLSKLKNIYKSNLYLNQIINIEFGFENFLIDNLEEEKTILDKKIVFSRKQSIFSSTYRQYFLEDKTWFTIYFDNNQPYEINLITQDSEQSKNLASQIKKGVLDKIPSTTDFKINFWNIAKYLILISIVVILFAVIFSKFYQSFSDSNIFQSVFEMGKNINPLFLLILWGSTFTFFIFQALLRYRLLRKQKIYVKYRHMFMIAWMSFFVSFITPLQIGGDLLAIWFLRRRGIPFSKLAATFVSASLIYQLALFVNILLFFSFGHNFYFLLFNTNQTVFYFFLISSLVTIVVVAFALILTISTKIQKLISKTLLYIVIRIPFFQIQDHNYFDLRVNDSLESLRSSIKFLWNKPLLILEMLAYEIIPRFFVGISVVNLMLGIVNTDLNLGLHPYLLQIVAANTIYTTNSLSISPGGSGTQELLTVLINSTIFKGANLTDANNNAAHSDLINKVFNLWPILIAGFGLLITTLIGEKRLQTIWRKNRDSSLKKTNEFFISHYYRYATIFWIIAIAIFILTIFLLLLL